MLIKNIKWLSLIVIISRVSWFLSIAIYAVAVGVDSFGSFSFFLGFWLITNKFSGLGIEIWVTKFISKNREKIISIVNPFNIRVLLSLLLFIFAIIILGNGNYESFNFFSLFLIIGFRQLFEGIREFLVGVIHGYQRMELQAQALIPLELLQLLSVVFFYFILKISDPVILSIPFLLVSIFKVISLNRIIIKINPNIWKKNCDSPNILFILSSSLPIGIMAITYMMYFQSQIIILRFTSTPKEVGIYSATLLIITASDVIMGIFRQAQFPILAEQYRKKNNTFIINILKKFKIYFILSLFLSLIVIILSIIIEKYISLGDYLESIYLLKYFCFLIPVLAVNSFWGNVINATNLSKVVAKKIVWFYILTLPINIILIRNYGSIGVFLFLLISMNILSYYYYYLVKNTR